MKYFYILLAALLAFTSCSNPAPPPSVATYEPAVTFGYVGNVYMAKVYDSQGQSYLMPYNQFTTSYAHGGYNAVTQEYYTHRSLYHPYDSHVHFVTSNAADARMYSSGFRESYHHASITRHVYRPPVVHQTVVHRTVVHTTPVVVRPPVRYVPPARVNLVKSTSRMNLQKRR
jgi:hypothetical protein